MPLVWAPNLESCFTDHVPYTNEGPCLKPHPDKEDKGKSQIMGPDFEPMADGRSHKSLMSKHACGSIASKVDT